MSRYRYWLFLPLLLLLVGCGTGRFTPQGWSGLAISDDVLYVASGEGRLLALDLARGSDQGAELWSYPAEDDPVLGSVYGAPAVTADTAYLATSYIKKSGGLLSSSPPPTGTLFAFSLQEGDQQGRSPPPPKPFQDFPPDVGGFITGPVVAGDKLLIGSSDGTLYAVDRRNGGLQWSFSTGGRVWSAPTVDEEAGVVYFGSLDHTLYAVDLRRGEERWRFQTEGAITGTPLLLGGKVYVGSFDRKLYALDANNGVEVWAEPVHLDGWAWAGPVAYPEGDTVYVATLGGTLYAFDPRSGNERWLQPFQAGAPLLIPPILLPGNIVVLSDDKTVYILSRDSGQETCPFPRILDELVRAPAVARGDLAYVIDANRQVHEINARECRINQITGLTRR